MEAYQNPCPSCGGSIVYSAEMGLMNCEYCGYTESLSDDNDQVIEQSLINAINNATDFNPGEIGQQLVDCQSCGAKYMVEADAVELACPFCASRKINTNAYQQNYIQPQGILPFQISREVALEKFKKWLGSGWFHPNSLTQLAELEKLHGVYLPYWTFDAQTYTEWSGQAGFHYYETKQVRVNGQMQTQQVQRTRWENRSGRFNHFFDDVLIIATKSLRDQEIQRMLSSFRLDEVINFDPKVILGWEAEIYNVDVEQGFQKADNVMDARIRGMVISRIGGNTQRIHHIETKKSDHTFKHLILPVWLCAYRFKNKVYQVVVNGQTGWTGGAKPYSWWKITLAVLAVAAIIGAFIFFSENY